MKLELALAALVVGATPCVALAQNVSSSGASWSSGWGFASASDRNVALSRSQAIRQAKSAGGPSTVVTTNNDNRSNYVENITDRGTITASMQNGDIIDHLGDEIGNNTNSVGSMNTGTTNLTIDGSNNDVVATNSADNTGCVDGSVNTSSSSLPGLGPVAGLGDDPSPQLSGDA